MDLTEPQIIAFSGHRAEAWRYDLLNIQDRKIGELDGVTGATFEFSVASTIRSSGSLECRAVGIDWLKVRIQPWYTMEAEGEIVTWPIGVFIPASPGIRYSGDGINRTIDLYDKLQILDQDRIENTYSVAPGVVVTDEIKALLAGIGETRDAITPSSATVRNAMVWEADTSKLQIINDLLASVNFFSLWVDGYGVFQGTPYQPPGGRGISWIFEDNFKSIYSPDFFNDKDDFNVPNKVVLVSTSDGDTAALTAVATNEDPDSPYSFNQRGRWLTTTEKDIEVTSQTTLNLMVQRRMVELSEVSSTYDIEHALIPLNLNDAVKFIRSTEGISTVGVVQKMSFGTGVGEMVKTTIREVTL